ncbi:hypothetical protein ACFOHY_16475 [Rhizobium rosettiformans]|uniref:hypothetical protein n=1 Tax=Rhizobium rosettiformans TaxID=1368430 RepID=UPI003610421F
MFKFLWKPTTHSTPAPHDWRHDPMGHPTVRDMSLRELADLPMVAEVPKPARTVERQACGGRQSVGRMHAAACALPR